MTSPRKVWINGKIVDESEAKLSIYDSALLFGDCCFEMTRSFNHVQFKLREHLERLQKSIKYLRIPLGMTTNEMENACYQAIEANPFPKEDEHRLMINVTRGALGIYKDAASTSPNFIVSDFPLRWTTAGMGKLYDSGVNCVIPPQRTIPASLLEPKVKNRSRIHYLMANIEASLFKGENVWPLLLDPDGFIAEGTGCNFFIVKDGVLSTPEPRNILRGISRDYVLTIYDDFTRETNIEPYDVYDADEAFVTGTPFCILPVVSLNGLPIGSGKPGWIVSELLYKWATGVGVDIKAQIQSWDNGAVDGPSPYKFK